jgi:parallel beta-helix repeat protein
VLRGGTGVTLSALSGAVREPAALRELAPGEWLLGANLEVLAPASLRVAAPEARWLMLSSGAGGFVSVKALGGGLDISGSCVTSWDAEQGRVDTEYGDGRSFLLARDGSRMTVDGAELRYLGYGEAESYGLAWRLAGTTGSITGSIVSHTYYGLYSHQVTGLVVRDNEFHDNVLYGIDPHTGSRELSIERNLVHDNGKHGIILAEDCTDSVIRDNVVYRNQHHGIVLYLHSDRNTIEGNESFDNVAQGININESSDNVIRDNRVYRNTESGVGIGQDARDNLVQGNEIRINQQDGIRLVTGSAGTRVRENLIGDNTRYGVYIDSDDMDLTGNTIFGNRFAVSHTGSDPLPDDSNEFDDNREGDVQQR